MAYGNLFKRAWNKIWEHKFLILLGVLVVLGSAGRGGNAGLATSWREGTARSFELEGPLAQFEGIGLPTVGPIVLVLLVGIFIPVGIVLWALATIAQGSLIAGVGAIDAGQPSSFGSALRAGWEKGWTLVGIGILPALPSLFIAALAAVGFAGYAGLTRQNAGPTLLSPNIALVAVLVGLVSLLGLLALVLSLLRTFANQACMLEGLGVLAAYRRGTAVLLENLGSALILFVLQIVTGVGLGLVLLLPGVVLALCCVLWPVLILVQGASGHKTPSPAGSKSDERP
jgi:hypothetical protein